MILPGYVLRCVDALEAEGFAAYAVGGCVRDAALGLTPHDYDLCTDARPDQIRRVFRNDRLVLAGEKHGTVTVITEGGPVEITTFRTEGDYSDSRHPGWVRFVPNIEADLARRDFTVNAMAFSPTRSYSDPFGGLADLEHGILRAVGDPQTRFREDALRILRGVRFSIRYRLSPDPATEQAMLALTPLLDVLARERVFDELCRLLPLASAQDILRWQRILCQVLPELAPTVGFAQHSPHHAYDVFTHTAHVVEATPPQLPLRLAALLHDIGKPPVFTLDDQGVGHFLGHAKRGAELANAALLRLKAPTQLRTQVTDLITRHMTPLEPDKRLLRRRMSQYGTQGVWDQLRLQEADRIGTGIPDNMDLFPQIAAILAELEAEDACLRIKDLAVDGRDLIALGFAPGPSLGAALTRLLEQVLDDRLPNERQALLNEAKHILKDR